MLVATAHAELTGSISPITTMEALTRMSVSDSRQEVETLCRRADLLADTLRRHYFRVSRRWTQHRQAEVARLIIESKSAVAEAQTALRLDDMRGAVAWLSGTAELFDRTFQLAMFSDDRALAE
jgi:hypothetical protein